MVYAVTPLICLFGRLDIWWNRCAFVERELSAGGNGDMSGYNVDRIHVSHSLGDAKESGTDTGNITY